MSGPAEASEGGPVLARGRLAALFVLVFASGALALIYELLWMRRFVTLFGASTPAVSAVLVGMFIGLGTGSWIWGARAGGSKNPVRTYGWLEMGVALGAIAVELFLRLYDAWYPALYQSLAPHPTGFLLVKTGLSVVALLLATLCMGGTLPLLSQAIAAESWHLGIQVGGLYATNTAGAALGAISVPTFWLRHLTVGASYGVTVGVSLLIGVCAVILGSGRGTAAAPVLAPPPAPSPRLRRGATPMARPLLLGLVGASGAWVFILQVSWSRMFGQVHENSVYSLALIMTLLLLGLAAGTGTARELLRRGVDARRSLGFAWIAAGVLILSTPRLFWELTGGLAYVNTPGGWTAYAARLCWLGLPTVFLPSLLAGMGFPLLMELAGESEPSGAGRLIGRLLSVNTAGSVAGSLVAGFLLPGTFGLWGTLGGVGIAMVATGGVACRSGTPERAMSRRGWLAPLLLLLTSGLLLADAIRLPRTRVRADHGEQLLALEEGSHGIVAVVESGGSRRIKLNNFYVLGGTASTGDERMQGHIPLLLHPKPREVAFLGLGTGITAGAALLHPAVERITAVEIVPGVIHAVQARFAEANLGVVDSPRVSMVAEDARDFLRGSGRHFDVIVGDLFVPWHHGESSLYTLDHFTAVRAGLNPGGLFCQWLPLFQLSEEEFNMIAATFMDLFPHTTLWRGDFAPGQPAVALVGHLDDAPLDPAVIQSRVAGLKPDPSNPFLVHPAGLWMFLGGALDPKSERFSRALRNRENRPWLELLGPLRHAGNAEGQAPLFVGRPLEGFLDQVRATPTQTGGLLRRLGAEELGWREAGAHVGAASIEVSEGHPAEAARELQRAIPLLPASLRPFFGPPPSPSP